MGYKCFGLLKLKLMLQSITHKMTNQYYHNIHPNPTDCI